MISARLRQAPTRERERERGVTRGEGGARDLGAAALPPPTIYRAPRGAPALGDPISKGGGGQRGDLPPKSSGAPPTPRVSNPRRRGRPKGGAPAHQGLVPLPLQPMGPSEIGGPTRWTPGTLSVVPVQYRLPPKLSRWPKLVFLYINLHLRTIPELLVTSGISSGTPNNFRVTVY